MKATSIKILLAGLLSSPACYSQTLAFNEVHPQFGPVAIGKASEPKIISISNTNNAPLFIIEINATGDFAQSNLCPIWLAEGSSCLIYITFTPQAAGPRSGKLFVNWAESGEQSLMLNGFGLQVLESHVNSVPSGDDPASRTKNDEEVARALSDDKSHSFRDLLDKNLGAIANEEEIFRLTKDSQLKQRIAVRGGTRLS
jgi:hypothetical protein